MSEAKTCEHIWIKLYTGLGMWLKICKLCGLEIDEATE